MNPLHYPDLERCKKLTEIGFPDTRGEHGFYPIGASYYTGNEEDGYHLFIHGNQHTNGRRENRFYAPTVMEMLDVIPNFIEDKKKRVFVIGGMGWYFHATKTYVDYSYTEGGNRYELVNLKGTLPNALADLIIWLVENKYLNFK